MEYYNIELMEKLDKLKVRTTYAKIFVLDFKTEKTIKEITGVISNGTNSVNTSSNVRRSINLTMTCTPETAKIESIKNLISIRTKIKVFVGLQNPFYESEDDKIQWFPQGLFVVTSASVSQSTTGITLSITGKDKGVLLNGFLGGVLPAPVVFSEKETYYPDGNRIIEYPTFFQIIQECVHHYGGEDISNIFINDIDEKARELVSYIGSDTVYFLKNDDDNYVGLTTDSIQASGWGNYDVCTTKKDIGYRITDFTYPGDLSFSAGSTVSAVLDKIVSTLGNFEYFYDLDGHFIFQQIKNYINTESPLDELEEEEYIRTYNNEKFKYELNTLETVVQFNTQPNFENIKNDFICWGKKNTSTGAEIAICYHLAIDNKPPITYANEYMYAKKDENGQIVDYIFEPEVSNIGETEEGYTYELVGIPSVTENNWREELYRLAVKGEVTNSPNSVYDAELIAYWRTLYDSLNEDWENGWNPAIKESPGDLIYWLDFIDQTSYLTDYSVQSIGRRTKVINEDSAHAVFLNQPKDVIFIRPSDTPPSDEQYFMLNDQYDSLFVMSNSTATCFDLIRDALYENLSFKTSINITCIPKYYYEPNNLIKITNKELGINDNFLITQFTVPLTYNGTMSISATKNINKKLVALDS